MLVINNEATTDDYSDALTLESPYGGRLVYLVANASAVVQMRRIPDDPHALVHDYGPEQIFTPQSSFVDRISAARFRSAVAGSPARIIASLSEPGDVLPASGTPFTGVLAASGGVGTTGVINKDTALIDVAASAAETDLYNFSVPAGALTSDGQLRLMIQGDFLYNNVVGNTVTIRIYLGGTLLTAYAMSGGVLAAVRRAWELRPTISALGATNSQMMTAIMNTVPPDLGGGAAPLAGIGGWDWRNNTPTLSTMGLGVPATLDMTAAQILRVTAQWSAASANNSWRKRYAILEAIS